MRVIVFLVAGLLMHGQTLPSDPARERFDGPIHYNEDVWGKLIRQRALELMTQAGISRAMVSATPGQGAEMLYRTAPGRDVPFLRPYSDRGKRSTWFRDTAALDDVRDQFLLAPYRGIGAFHLRGEDAQTPVVRELVKLAGERGMALHAHADLPGIRALRGQAHHIRVIWAHGGSDGPERTLHYSLGDNEQLCIELSFRDGIA